MFKRFYVAAIFLFCLGTSLSGMYKEKIEVLKNFLAIQYNQSKISSTDYQEMLSKSLTRYTDIIQKDDDARKAFVTIENLRYKTLGTAQFQPGEEQQYNDAAQRLMQCLLPSQSSSQQQPVVLNKSTSNSPLASKKPLPHLDTQSSYTPKKLEKKTSNPILIKSPITPKLSLQPFSNSFMQSGRDRSVSEPVKLEPHNKDENDPFACSDCDPFLIEYSPVRQKPFDKEAWKREKSAGKTHSTPEQENTQNSHNEDEDKDPDLKLQEMKYELEDLKLNSSDDEKE